MNNSYTDFKNIIERVKRDGFEDVNETDVKEYIWDVVGFIATPKLFETVDKEIEVVDYRAQLPVDFHELVSIRDKDTHIVYRKSTDKFHRFNKQPNNGNAIVQQFDSVAMDGDGNPLPDQITSFLQVTPERKDPHQYTYVMERGILFIPFEDATLEIVYKAFPIFDDYTPKIPDHPKIIRVIVDFIKMKIGERYRLQGRMDEQMLQRLEKNYAWSAASARSASLMNSPGEMENFKNRMIDIVPKVNSFRQGHKFLGEETL